MKIIKESVNFTQVSNDLLLDPKLSAKAKGIYSYLFSRPDNWDFSVDRIATDFKDGYKSINGGIKELEEIWYLARQKQNNGRNYYYIYQKPQEIHQTPKKASRQKGNQPKSQPAKKEGVSNTEFLNNKEDINNTNDTKVSEVKPPGEEENKLEVFWNPVVNGVEEAIKKACEEIGILYIPGEKERQVLRNIGRSTIIKDIVEKRVELKDVPDFVYKTIKLTRQDNFRNWKIFNWVTFRDHYGKFLNSFKWQKEASLQPKKANTYG